MTATLMNAAKTQLILIDYQARLMPAIDETEAVLANANRLLTAARMLGIPVLVTEQNPQGIGATTTALDIGGCTLIAKQTFGACATPEFLQALKPGADLVVAGCESHVCVTQTTLGLLGLGRKVFLVADACGSRAAQSKQAAIARLARNGAEIVTVEMTLFEWLRTSDHDQFKKILALVK